MSDFIRVIDNKNGIIRYYKFNIIPKQITSFNDSDIEYYDEEDFNFYKMLKDLDTKDKEIERLNNIINELEKWLKSEYERYLNDEENLVFSNVEAIDYASVLNKLKELKGSDKD